MTTPDRPPANSAAERIEKVMSLSRDEFQLSIVRVGVQEQISDETYRFHIASGQVDVRFSPQPGATFGGLLTLPRAIVSLEFHDVPPDARAEFLARFDNTFRRGGG